MDISVILLALTVALLVFRQAATDMWNQVASNRPGWRLAALLVLVMLLLAGDSVAGPHERRRSARKIGSPR
jgi:hypothetical protein